MSARQEDAKRYEIRIHGSLDESWLAWLDVQHRVEESGMTTLVVQMDQAGLVGLIRQLHGMGCVLTSITQLVN